MAIKLDYSTTKPTDYKNFIKENVKDKSLLESFLKECFVPKKNGKGNELHKKKTAKWINANLEGVTVVNVPADGKKGGKSIEDELRELLETL